MQEGRRRDRVHVLPEQDVPHLVEHEDQAEAEEHLGEVVAAIEALDEDLLEQEPDREGDRDAARERKPEAAGIGGDPIGEVGAEHVEGAVGEVDDAEDAEHERQPARDEEQQEPVLHPVQELDGEADEIHSQQSAVIPGLAKREPGTHKHRCGRSRPDRRDLRLWVPGSVLRTAPE